MGRTSLACTWWGCRLNTWVLQSWEILQLSIHVSCLRVPGLTGVWIPGDMRLTISESLDSTGFSRKDNWNTIWNVILNGVRQLHLLNIVYHFRALCNVSGTAALGVVSFKEIKYTLKRGSCSLSLVFRAFWIQNGQGDYKKILTFPFLKKGRISGSQQEKIHFMGKHSVEIHITARELFWMAKTPANRIQFSGFFPNISVEPFYIFIES